MIVARMSTEHAAKAIFGSGSAARVLLFLEFHGESHAARIAGSRNAATTPIANQLGKLEAAGILVSREIGRSRVYGWNASNPVVAPLRRFLRELGKSTPDTKSATDT